MIVAGPVETLVIGGGASGCAVAGLLAANSDENVLLLEAGPDYGARDSGRWPQDLLDATQNPVTHDWGYHSGGTLPDRVLTFDRARVIGGCGSHNGCQAMIGHRLDYDGWAAAGNPGWGAQDLQPVITSVYERLRLNRYAENEVTPFQQAAIDAMVAFGLPRVADLNDLDQDLGVNHHWANIVDGIRWNPSFAYIDPVRHAKNLQIIGDALCDHLIIEHGRVTGASVIIGGRRQAIEAQRVVLSAGVYGSPAILMRSGIGDPAGLHRHAIPVRHSLTGVGKNLHDHPSADLRFAGTDELVGRSRAFSASQFHPEEQVIGKGRTRECNEAFDLHFYTVGGARRADPDHFNWDFKVGLMTPMARGTVTLRSADPGALPFLDHAFLSDPRGADLDRLTEGFEQYEEIVSQQEFAELLGDEVFPGPQIRSKYSKREIVARTVSHCFHPVGTCKMGPAGDVNAVVDANGHLHGLEGCLVADASIIPVVPRANTHLPSVLVGERIAAGLMR